MQNIYDGFTNKYSLSKTLRFELIPQGSTLENMKIKGIIEADERKQECYEKCKALIDGCHKWFMDDTLQLLRLRGLEEYYHYFNIPNRTAEERIEFAEIQASLRKQVSDIFSKNPIFKKLFGIELFKEVLPKMYQDEENLQIINDFQGFTSYFTSFNRTRAHFYSPEEKANTIAYRLIHENLPIYIQNMHMFQKFMDMVPDSDSIMRKMLKEYEMYLPVNSVEDFFKLDSYDLVLTQTGITQYNMLIGGYSLENGEKIKGMNEYINTYNQKADKGDRIGSFKKLRKQILSDTQTVSFIPPKFETDIELLTAVREYSDMIAPIIGSKSNKLTAEPTSMLQLMLTIRYYDLEKIYIRHDAITEISQYMYGNWNFLNSAMETWYDMNYTGTKKFGTKAYEQERMRYFKNIKSYSIKFLDTCLAAVSTRDVRYAPIESYFEQYMSRDSGENYYLKYLKFVDGLSICDSFIEQEKKFNNQSKVIAAIKDYLDMVKEYQKFLKCLVLKEEGLDYDHQFYDLFEPMYEKIDDITLLYNKCRNYLTKKPYSKDKIKLNFYNANLMSGWSITKESINLSVILRKDGLYYLGIIDTSSKKVFEGNLPADGPAYEKMEYRLLPGANKMLPKCLLTSKKAVETFNPSPEIKRIYNAGTFKKGKDFSLEDCHTLIDYFKKCISIHDEWSKFGFNFSDTSTYEDISGFYREVEAQGYMVTFKNVSESYIDKLVDSGKLYLFQIYNQDFSPYSHGKPNLHTMYFKALFEDENLQDVVYKLNGEGEIFYRKRSINEKDMITHPANQAIKNKNPLNPNTESVFPYTIYKDRRYTMDKFHLHIPITMNFKSGSAVRFNADVNRVLKNNDVNVIGVNRGERNLLYVTVIDPKGNILEHQSLNVIEDECNGVIHKKNYQVLLEERANEREEARKNWDTIENIKELKNGYLSQAIHRIVQLMEEYQAILVIEDFSFGFTRGRQAIEKNIYQQFVQRLINKLNYVVDKTYDKNQDGGLYHAYQLTYAVNNLKELGKQNGFLFFAPSFYISNIDPVTGFVSMINAKYESVKAAKELFAKFDGIYYDKENDYFCFETDYSKFTEKSKGTKEHWTICTYGDRVRSFRNPKKNMVWDQQKIDLTKALKDLFERTGIDYEKSDVNLQESILQQEEKGFFEGLCSILSLTLQMRNYSREYDYLVSPVMDKNGMFFDSRNNIDGLPVNIEANASYNLALKGLLMLNKIKEADESKLGKEKLNITNEEWLSFVQEQ